MALTELVAKLRADITQTDARVEALKTQMELAKGLPGAPTSKDTASSADVAKLAAVVEKLKRESESDRTGETAALKVAVAKLNLASAGLKEMVDKFHASVDTFLAEKAVEREEADMLRELEHLSKCDDNPWFASHAKEALKTELAKRRLNRECPDAAFSGWMPGQPNNFNWMC